jgi:protein ImuB
LSALVGDTRIGSPVLLDSHRPDAFEMHAFRPEGHGARPVGATVRSRASELPLVRRRQRVPPAIRESVEHGRPVYIASSRRGMTHGAVIEAAGPWPTSGDWWEDGYNRDEWDVARASGVVCRIFHDRTAERWFLEAIYD